MSAMLSCANLSYEEDFLLGVNHSSGSPRRTGRNYTNLRSSFAAMHAIGDSDF